MRRVQPRGDRWALNPANRVTLVRALLTAAVAGLLLQPSAAAVVALAVPALVLDGVDGWVARRRRCVTTFGARFDMETDALLILVLSLHVARTVGPWVLLLGLARYLLLLAQWLWPRLRGPVEPRRWRKVVAVVQGVVLVVAASGLLPAGVTVAALVVAAALLLVSFGTEARERLAATRSVGGPERTAAAGLLSVLAVVVVWAALVAPHDDGDLSPWLLARVPLEGLVLVVAVLLLPERWGRRLAVPFGLVAAALVVLKALDVGFAMVLDRPFSLLGDWGYLGPAVGVLGDSVGRATAWLVVAAVGVGVVALFVLLPLATRRVVRVVRGHRRPAVAAVAGVAALGLLASLLGPSPLSAASAGLAVAEVRAVRADLHDRSVFADRIRADPYDAVPGERLLRGLRGKDVLLVFVESYGRVAVDGGSFAPGVDAVLADGTSELDAAGYRSRSAWLTSPTFGAASWLAHATTQSGLWVDSQRRYDQLLGSDRLTLSGAFDRAGWRTVFDVPAIDRDWPEGERFYGFDELYDSRNVGYAGPRFGYATMPDQFTLSRFRELELAPGDRPPVMAEIDLVSSHHPWAPLPEVVPWDQVGDGSVFDGMPERGDTAEEVLADTGRTREAYGRSVEYSLRTVVSFLTTYPDDDLVVVMLGDHQPHHYVSGEDPGYDVPVSVIARDPEVMRSVAGWGWAGGLRPTPEGPVWPMADLRDRMLTTFADEPSAPSARRQGGGTSSGGSAPDRR